MKRDERLRMLLEAERKYLVRKLPDWSAVKPRVLHISQEYLTPDPEHPERVERLRTVTVGDPLMGVRRYYHTIKVHLGPGENDESESEIEVEEYRRLLDRLDPDAEPVHKTRHVFEWEGFTFELDEFIGPSWVHGLLMLEVELPSIETEVVVPPFVRVEREVTGEKKYTNWAIARGEGWDLSVW